MIFWVISIGIICVIASCILGYFVYNRTSNNRAKIGEIFVYKDRICGVIVGLLSSTIMIGILIPSCVSINNHFHIKWIIEYKAVQSIYNSPSYIVELAKRRYDLDQWYQFGVTDEIRAAYDELTPKQAD